MILDKDVNIELQNDNGGKGRVFVSKFIEPALVGYGDKGVLNVTLESLNRFCQTLVGCPVIVKHQKVTDENADEIRVGVISGVEYTSDGWFSCTGIIWDNKAIELIGKGWSVSCTYEVLETTGISGERNNIPFDDELINGRFLHLAIVPNPRYEKATITLMNSKGKEMWNRIFNSRKLKEEKEKDMEDKKEDLEKIENSEESKEPEKENEKESDKETEEKESKCNSDSETKEEEVNNSEDEKSEDKEESKESEEKENADEEDDSKEEKENSEDKTEEVSNSEEEDKKVKDNSKEDDLNILHNSCFEEKKPRYESEKVRLALGTKLF